MHIEYAQVITQIISFLLMLWILSRFAWKPITSTLEARRSHITADLEKNAQENVRLSRMIDEYDAKVRAFDKTMQESMQKVLAEARAEGEKTKDQARQQARAFFIKAQEDVQKEIDRAHVELKKDLVNMVLLATQKILPTTIDKDSENHLMMEEITKHMEGR
jgi:F-type H+-transporting ATPase subunit b